MLKLLESKSSSTVLFSLAICLLIGLSSLFLEGCTAFRITESFSRWEGPRLNYGRMSSTLGAVKLKDNRIVVIGGSPTENPFAPYINDKAIEILDSAHKKWSLSKIKISHPLAGKAYLLPDGRIFAYASVYSFDKQLSSLSSAPAKKGLPGSGPVSAVIIDLQKGSYTPLYRPKKNKLGAAPLAGKGPAILQRAFARSIQLKDGRIIRIGGTSRYSSPPYVKKCQKNQCTYCLRKTCTSLKEDPGPCNVEADCPDQKSAREKLSHKTIEVYTPPSSQHPLGSVKTFEMNEGRSSLGVIQMKNQKVLITGGWGPKGVGENKVYNTSYIFDPLSKFSKKALIPGITMLVGREDHSNALLGDGRVLITGGTNKDEETQASSEIFDPKTGLFAPGPPLRSAREDHRFIPLGPLLLFAGGEIKDKADHISNLGEIYNSETVQHVGTIFLYSRFTAGEGKDYAGIDDFAMLQLNTTKILLLGGQQGLQDRDGDYISAGRGSRRTLFIEYKGKL